MERSQEIEREAARLREALNFTDSDLAMNRIGRLGNQQEAVLGSSSNDGSTLAFWLGGLVGLAFTLLPRSVIESSDFRIGGSLAMAIFAVRTLALGGWLFALYGLRSMVSGGPVGVFWVTGEARYLSRRRGLLRPYPIERVQVGGMVFEMPYSAPNAFVEGQTYTVYFLWQARPVILSAYPGPERIDKAVELVRFKQGFKTSASDLALNREGQLSEEQQMRYEAWTRIGGRLALWVGLPLALVFTLLPRGWLINRGVLVDGSDAATLYVTWLLAVIGWVSFGYGLRKTLRPTPAQVQRTSGVVTDMTIHGRTPLRPYPVVRLYLGDTQFELAPGVPNVLVEGRDYTVYYFSRLLPTIIAAEPETTS